MSTVITSSTICRLLQNATRLEWVAEHPFHDVRKWRFDFACVPLKIAIEVEGGVWTRGRHTRGRGCMADMDKYNVAAISGWLLLRFTPGQMASGEFARTVFEAVETRQDQWWSETGTKPPGT